MYCRTVVNPSNNERFIDINGGPAQAKDYARNHTHVAVVCRGSPEELFNALED